MNSRPPSLLRALLRSLLWPSLIAIAAGLVLSFWTVRQEYDEMLDIGLNNKAHLLLENLTMQDEGILGLPEVSDLLAFEARTLDPEERTLFWYIDSEGNILQRSGLATPDMMPREQPEGFFTEHDYRFRVLSAEDMPKRRIVVGEPLVERNEAMRDILAGVMLSFAALVLIMAYAASRALQGAARKIDGLSEDIAAKSEHNLSPIDRAFSFAEFEPAIDTLDELMARLDAAINAERDFATVAAHELRTPVAICLAQAQRLKATAATEADAAKAAAVEQSLKRLARLIERLLQLSRAQSGLGTNAEADDLNTVLRLLLGELNERKPTALSLNILPPEGVYMSHINPDAFGIILNNLFDNALKYSDGPQGILIDASQAGVITVSNDCDALTEKEIQDIKKRFGRKSNLADGYGLGLSIVQALCEQTGCDFDIFSPMIGQTRGFVARIILP